MASQIRITPEQMRGRAKEYREQAEVVGEVITKMDSLLSALQGEWEGAASEAYAARFMELRPGFVEAQDLISQIATALDNTAQIVEQTDNDIASAFKG